MAWLPVDQNTPKDRPILGWCDHKAAKFTNEDGSDSAYSMHCDLFNQADDGPQVLVWGGEINCEFGRIPPWWFRHGSDWEDVANPTHWMDIPAAPQPVAPQTDTTA